ncbi:jg15213 [Pararge aegeria aegeria]|uniref:Jg15213 protein n=1 Tax=Pararge aegeria aegeria TaxID=348720 RepID=A0A8S4QJJ5_9NEOP|nr:jg15213 [Pararge aegeria aegeria]
MISKARGFVGLSAGMRGRQSVPANWSVSAAIRTEPPTRRNEHVGTAVCHMKNTASNLSGGVVNLHGG